MDQYNLTRVTEIALATQPHLPNAKNSEGKKGPKSKWSAHQKMWEAGLHGKLVTDFDDLTAQILPLLPKHWDMSNYGMIPRKDGEHARFADKKGKAHGGIAVSIRPEDILHFYGYVVGLTEISTKMTKKIDHRMKHLGICVEDDIEYIYSLHGKVATSTGRGPIDAYAQLLIKTSTEYYNHNYDKPNGKEKLDAEKIFRNGYLKAKNKIGKEFTWGISKVLWHKLQTHEAILRLPKKSTTISARNYQPWLYGNMEDIDNTLIAALTLADSLTIPNKDISFNKYVVTNPHSSEATELAWCENSALLAKINTILLKGTIPISLQSWNVHKLGLDEGQKARRILLEAFPNTQYTQHLRKENP
jgi:hypothetical protein